MSENIVVIQAIVFFLCFALNIYFVKVLKDIRKLSKMQMERVEELEKEKTTLLKFCLYHIQKDAIVREDYLLAKKCADLYQQIDSYDTQQV